MHVQPQGEHEWLQQLVGEWTYEHECVMGPDQPPATVKGTDSVRSLGGPWVLCEGQGEMPGGGIGTTLMTLGYDPARKKFVGTFIGSMMTYLWVYEGELDPGGRALTLDTEGPSFSDPTKLAKYHDIITMVAPDHRTLTSECLTEDGKWVRFMTAHYRKKR